ncbi:efflux RND transporter periplasmic adaptor subunit [Myxococcota bacterium]|nr:efflux RND transporter periplasmic adaptor subunit [Myxococcota bacterium]
MRFRRSTERLVIMLLAAGLVAGCGSEPDSLAASPPQDPMVVVPDATLAASLELGSVTEAEVRDTLRVQGRIDVDDQRVTRIGSSVTGRITELHAIVGQQVEKGRALARLSSTELSATQLEFLKSYSEQLLTERAVERAQQLYDADVIGLAELQRRQAALAQSEAGVSAARDQLAVLGMTDRAIRSLVETRHVTSISTVVASLSGTVIARNGTLGQVVQPADTIFVIADLSHVWLVADVPEQSAAFVTSGAPIEAEVAALPGRRIAGTLSFVSATVAPETRTVQVRMDLPNPTGDLKPAMLATVSIQGALQKTKVIPDSAIVRVDDKDHVFVQIAPDRFRLREVALGAELGGRRILHSGLSADEKIVIGGAFHLNNERSRTSAGS